MQSTLEATGLVSLGIVFTLFFVTLGPLKLLGPFAQLTRDTDESALRQIVVRAFVIGLVAVLAGGFVGQFLLLSWNIPVATMELAGAIIFLLVGLRMVLEQYSPVHAAPPPLPTLPMAAAMRIAFPLVVTPYGIAALIALLANSHDFARTTSILAILIGVMVLNLLALLFVRRIMAGMMIIVLQILGAVLGVLQVALAVEMIVRGLQGLGILHA
jgi:multiple antibiotic resistance protein